MIRLTKSAPRLRLRTISLKEESRLRGTDERRSSMGTKVPMLTEEIKHLIQENKAPQPDVSTRSVTQQPPQHKKDRVTNNPPQKQ
jgi:hypothetical protein